MKLTVIHNSKDLSLKVDDLSNQISVIDLTKGKLRIGYFKPIKNIYVEMKSRVIIGEDEIETPVSDSLIIEHHNGQEFVAPKNVQDYTFGLTKSGLISWDNSDGNVFEIDGKKLYWIELTTQAPAQLEINGINLVLSNDRDLISSFPTLLSYLPDNAKSFIGFHQEARDTIVQYIQNSGKVIKDFKGEVKSVDQFDLVNINEFKMASKKLALSLIFSWLSRDNDDRYADKASEYKEEYYSCLNSRLMTIDDNNDGKTRPTELGTIQTVVITNV